MLKIGYGVQTHARQGTSLYTIFFQSYREKLAKVIPRDALGQLLILRFFIRKELG